MRQRVLTAVVLAPIVLAAAASTSPWPIFVLAGIILLIGLDEVRKLLRHRVPSFVPPVLFLLLVNQQLSGRIYDRLSVATVCSLLFLVGVVSAGFSAKRGSSTLIGESLEGFWVAMPLYLLFHLHQVDAPSDPWRWKTLLLLVLLPVWAGDIAAMLVGKAIGRHPLAPAISPKKTWEGAGGNFFAASLVGWGTALLIGAPPYLGIASGLAAGTLGQVGDLFESYVKRRAGVKDSGTLLPGHGGILDRIDAVLFTAPAVALLHAIIG